MLNNVSFYFFRTFDSGNIGSTLRSMKNMDLGKLYVVDPINFEEEKILKLSAGAKKFYTDSVELLNSNNVKDKLFENNLIIATTNRIRSEMNFFDFDTSIDLIINYLKRNCKVAIIFGNETNGLTNEEIELANFSTRINTSTAYSSLNLSQAALIFAYEIFKKYNSASNEQYFFDEEIANNNEKEILFNNFINLLDYAGFSKGETRNRSLFYWKQTFNKFFLFSSREIKNFNDIVLYFTRYFKK